MSNQFDKFAKCYLERLKAVLDNLEISDIDLFVNVLLNARELGNTIFFAGNGGSAATASHFANDLAMGTRQESKPFKVISIGDNLATLTALGNDYGYDQIFSKQVSVYAKERDVLVGISASGNSQNLISAFEVAKKRGLITVALTAFDGGTLRQIADHSVYVPTKIGEYGPAEDAHLILDHLITNYFLSTLNPA
jgi:D-sedoheptulose 7-phosphate isomerase